MSIVWSSSPSFVAVEGKLKKKRTTISSLRHISQLYFLWKRHSFNTLITWKIAGGFIFLHLPSLETRPQTVPNLTMDLIWPPCCQVSSFPIDKSKKSPPFGSFPPKNWKLRSDQNQPPMGPWAPNCRPFHRLPHRGLFQRARLHRLHRLHSHGSETSSGRLRDKLLGQRFPIVRIWWGDHGETPQSLGNTSTGLLNTAHKIVHRVKHGQVTWDSCGFPKWICKSLWMVVWHHPAMWVCNPTHFLGSLPNPGFMQPELTLYSYASQKKWLREHR